MFGRKPRRHGHGPIQGRGCGFAAPSGGPGRPHRHGHKVHRHPHGEHAHQHAPMQGRGCFMM